MYFSYCLKIVYWIYYNVFIFFCVFWVVEKVVCFFCYRNFLVLRKGCGCLNFYFYILEELILKRIDLGLYNFNGCSVKRNYRVCLLKLLMIDY